MAWLSLIGSGVQAVSQYAEGQQAKKLAERSAVQIRASSQRDAIAERRRAMLLKSRALAVAAASGGGGVEDPTVSKLIADINAQGEMNALGALYEGEEEATGLELGGQVRRSEGRARATSSILGGASDYYANKYA
jgi:hypothetical protein